MGLCIPSLKEFDLDNFANDISAEMGSFTFKELSLLIKNFLIIFKLINFLHKIIRVAKKVFGSMAIYLTVSYCQKSCSPGNINEQYRAHFDSHIFTLVLLLKLHILHQKITLRTYLFLKIRKMPKNEIINLIEKFCYKRFASKKGLKNLKII